MNTNIKLNLILTLVAIIGITLSSFSGWSLYKAEEKSIVSTFQNTIDERAASLYRELLINFETLRSLAILFDGESIPEYTLFQNVAQKITNRHGDIQALEWIPYIIQSERNQYVSRIRQYFPRYEITERQEQGIMVPAKERQEYYPVYFVEPLIGNETALGFDLASNPIRLDALKKSRDSALPQATASITLVQEMEKQKGFLAFLPIYRGGSPATVNKRRETLVGFILGVYRIGDIFTSSVLSNKVLGIEIKLIDETSITMNDILFTHKPETASPSYENILYRKVLPEIWGRKWSLVASPTTGYIATRRSILPLVVLGFGLIFTAFIVLYIRMISKRATIIQRMVIDKTDELSKANKRLELLSRSDGLTGIFNRRFMDYFLNREWLRAIRNKSFISFILIDIDYFKLYNDNYGHLMGDECLKKVAAKLGEIPKRPTDMIARYGGEEFALVLAETEIEKAKLMADNCRQAVEALQIQHEFSETAEVVTISIGVCTFSPINGTDPRFIIDCADKALYKAKKTGRNKVEMFLLDS